jgi:hypothetical protein
LLAPIPSGGREPTSPHSGLWRCLFFSLLLLLTFLSSFIAYSCFSIVRFSDKQLGALKPSATPNRKEK